jgi:hypothetical protein
LVGVWGDTDFLLLVASYVFSVGSSWQVVSSSLLTVRKRFIAVFTEFLTTPLNELQIRTYITRVTGFRNQRGSDLFVNWTVWMLKFPAFKAGNLSSFSSRILLRELGFYVNMSGFRSPPKTVLCGLANMVMELRFSL